MLVVIIWKEKESNSLIQFDPLTISLPYFGCGVRCPKASIERLDIWRLKMGHLASLCIGSYSEELLGSI